MTRPQPRRAGSPWRILVHKRSPDPAQYRTYDVSNDPGKPAKRAETMRALNAIRPDMPDVPDTAECTVLEGTEFDELVIGEWIHLEQMDTGRWWCNFAGVTINVSVDRDGRPKRVDVYGPGDYAEPEKGCTYEVAWSAGSLAADRKE